MCALIERSMDTTHTFHLPFGEMTITPFDFAAITGLSFSGSPLHLVVRCIVVVVRNRWLKDLFSVTASLKSGCSSLIWYTQLVNRVRSKNDSTHVSSK